MTPERFATDRPSRDLSSHDLPGRGLLSGPGGVPAETGGGAQPSPVRQLAEPSSIHPPEPTRRRVAPLAPDDRRAALVEATVPLLIENGSAISTRQIAQAAGVAEGTIFRVFPDKSSLILAALRRALDPEHGENALRAIPADLELRERVTQAAAIMLAGLSRFGRLHMIARELIIDLGPASDFGAEMRQNNLRIQEAMASVFEPDAARLRLSPSNAARLLMLNVVGMSGFAFGEVQQIDPAAIVAILFDGLVLPPADANAPARDNEASTNEAEASTSDAEASAPDVKVRAHAAEAPTNEESSRPGHSKESTC